MMGQATIAWHVLQALWCLHQNNNKSSVGIEELPLEQEDSIATNPSLSVFQEQLEAKHVTDESWPVDDSYGPSVDDIEPQVEAKWDVPSQKPHDSLIPEHVVAQESSPQHWPTSDEKSSLSPLLAKTPHKKPNTDSELPHDEFDRSIDDDEYAPSYLVEHHPPENKTSAASPIADLTEPETDAPPHSAPPQNALLLNQTSIQCHNMETNVTYDHTNVEEPKDPVERTSKQAKKKHKKKDKKKHKKKRHCKVLESWKQDERRPGTQHSKEVTPDCQEQALFQSTNREQGSFGDHVFVRDLRIKSFRPLKRNESSFPARNDEYAPNHLHVEPRGQLDDAESHWQLVDQGIHVHQAIRDEDIKMVVGMPRQLPKLGKRKGDYLAPTLQRVIPWALCSESFVQEWPDVPQSLSSGMWADESLYKYAKTEEMTPCKTVSLHCTSVLDYINVHIETPGGTALMIHRLSHWESPEHDVRSLFWKLATVAISGRYNKICNLLCVDTDITEPLSAQIANFQCAAFGLPFENKGSVVTCHYVNEISLAAIVAHHCLGSRSTLAADVSIDDLLNDNVFVERLMFLMRLAPALSVCNGIEQLHQNTIMGFLGQLVAADQDTSCDTEQEWKRQLRAAALHGLPSKPE
jgi:hypothetical protein